MNAQTLRELIHHRPFKPFRIILSGGESYAVRHPEMALLTRSDVLVGIDVKNGLPAEFRICSLLHVATVEPMDHEPAA